MTYSSALYKNTNALYEAQQNKYDRILSKFDKARANVLEIGCGWGGFADAPSADHHVTGLTISPSQHKFATQRLKGLATSGWRITGNPKALSTTSSPSKCSRRWVNITGRTISPRLPNG